MFNLSTSWNSLKHDNARDLLDEIKSLRFDNIEMGFSLTAKVVKELIALKKNNEITVDSLHNFCPVPEGYEPGVFTPDFFSLSSPDETERQKALTLTFQSMDTAKEVNAKAVIIHAGRVEMEQNQKELIQLYNLGLKGTPGYNKLISSMREERQAKKDPYFSAIVKSLRELVSYAERIDIKICIENRYYLREIPNFRELGVFFELFNGSKHFFYWHDVGHAQARENLGFEKHLDYLNSYADKIFGVHLHDIRGACDHMVPGAGDFNFSLLKPYFKKNTIKVIEVHQPARGKAIMSSIDYLKKSIGDPNIDQ